jgi:F-type H+-transporting ATPase subunit b
MIDRSQKEATSIVEEAEDKATKRAEHIVTEAKAQLDNDIRTARETLKQETTALVAYATEKVVKQKVDAKKDASLIESALKEAS